MGALIPVEVRKNTSNVFHNKIEKQSGSPRLNEEGIARILTFFFFLKEYYSFLLVTIEVLWSLYPSVVMLVNCLYDDNFFLFPFCII